MTIDDPIYPLDRATNEPPPITPTVRRCGSVASASAASSSIARYGSGWPLPGNRAGDVAYFVEKRDQIRRALDAVGRDPDDFTFAAQVDCGSTAADRRTALKVGREFQTKRRRPRDPRHSGSSGT